MPTPNELFQEASCFNCASNASMSDLLKLALLQRIAEGGGGGGGTPGGANGSVQFNNGGAFGGFGNYNSGTSVLTLPGDLIFSADNADDIGASGATRPRTGYFGTSVVTPLATILAAANANAIAVTGYSLTGANTQPMLSLAGTWNTSGTPTAIDLNITDTASNAASLLMNLRVGVSSMFEVRKNGIANLAGLSVGAASSAFGSLNQISLWQAGIQRIALIGSTQGINLQSAIGIRWSSTNSSQGSVDTSIFRNAAGIVEVSDGNAGTFRDIKVRTAFTNNAASLVSTNTALTDFAGAGAGTLTNAPTAGDPTKWIAIVDNGTTRYIPTWT